MGSNEEAWDQNKALGSWSSSENAVSCVVSEKYSFGLLAMVCGRRSSTFGHTVLNFSILASVKFQNVIPCTFE